MKRILTGIFAAVTALSISVGAFAATSTAASSGRNSVTVSSGHNKEIEFSYSTDTADASETSIRKLFLPDLQELKLHKNEGLVEKLTIKSNSVNGTPVSFTLRLENTETSTTSPNILDYYELTITDVTDKDNEIPIYNYTTASSTASSAQYKDIELGTLNTQSNTSDTATYRLYITANSELSSRSTEAEDNIDWLLITNGRATTASTTVKPTASAAVKPTASAAVKPTATASPRTSSTKATATPKPTIYVATIPTPTPSTRNTTVNTVRATTKPQANVISGTNTGSSQNADELLFDKGTYTVGTDLPAGKYTIKGNGNVKIYNSDGELEDTIKLVADNETGEGVAREYAALDRGDTVEIADYAVFTPSTTATTRPSTKPTATPRTTNKPTSTPKASTKVTTKPSSTKNPTATTAAKTDTNPKTGDNAPIAAIALIGIAAFGTAAFIEYRKRKNH